MKKKYLIPEAELVRLSGKSGILQGSNGEDLRVTTYGDRGDSDDDVDNFWK